MESRTTQQWQAADLDNYLHPFTDHKALQESKAAIIVRGEGCYVWDSEGNRYLDGLSGLACVNIGYGRKELADVAAKQMNELSYFNSFFKSSNPKAIALAEKLSTLAPGSLNHVFYANSGSEANDTAYRMVRQYWALQGKPERQIVISREAAYHGSTVAGGALSGMPPMHEQGAALPNIVHVQCPYQFEYGRDEEEVAFGLKAAGWLEEKILEVGADKVAAFFAEPIQGAGGGKFPPAGYFKEIQRICSKYDVLLVIDEVICGFGRTGKWFASEVYDIQPDLMCLAKGITSAYVALSAVMVSDRIADTLIEKGGEFYHGFTYSGHPVACAVALENIRIMEDEGLIQKVADETGPHLKSRLEGLLDHPLVADVNAQGMMASVELVNPDGSAIENPEETCEMFRDLGLANGIIVRPIDSTIMMCPPLIIECEQVDFLIDQFRRSLDQFQAHLESTHLAA